MATQVQLRRGDNTAHGSFTGVVGEVTVNTTNDSIHIHDGSTTGGFELLRADLNNITGDTDDLSEGSSNLYYTNARVDAEIDSYLSGGTGITVSGGAISIDFTEFSTTNITEGTNLYYTDARADARADARITASGAISDVVDDTTPQLGGDLDLNSSDITGTGNIDITGTITSNTLTVKAGASGYNGIFIEDDGGDTASGLTHVNGGFYISRDGNLDNISITSDKFRFQHETSFRFNKPVEIFGDLTISNDGTVNGRDIATDGTKLDGIEASADVTDATNVEAAGALMDSEVTNLAQVKAFDSSDYATAAQGTTADAALPKTGGAMTGAITTNSTFDGRDVATDGAKLDGIETGATADQTAAEILTAIKTVDGATSGLDADLLDGNHASAFATAAQGALADSALQSETVTSIALNSNSLDYTDENGTTTNIDLSAYLDEDSRAIASGTLNSVSGVVTFTRDDDTTFTLDLSDLLDDTNLVTSVAGKNGVVTLDADDIDDASTTNKFTTAAEITKLAGIETGADVTDTTNVVAALTAGTNVSIAANGTISSTDTNTTYSVGDGGLTEKNFTTALNTKLSGIETGATADQTASEILTAIKTVDGAASGLDADLLDGQQGSHYLDYNNFTNTPTIPTNNNQLTNGAGYITADTQLSNEQVQDIVGAMVSSNTESGISVTYQDADGTLDFNVNDPTITLTGAVTGSATMTNLGNVSIATTATADPTLTINGDASGSATFTNLGNATLTLTIADDSHNHTIANVDGLQTALNAKAALASPSLTGTPTAPTASTGTNTTQLATTAFVQQEIAALKALLYAYDAS